MKYENLKPQIDRSIATLCERHQNWALNKPFVNKWVFAVIYRDRHYIEDIASYAIQTFGIIVAIITIRAINMIIGPINPNLTN